jgi:branched-subunit amino acid aminotransferase/4-amino-4-deoxychorismate lyase
MIWVRGQILADDALQISVLDRTFEHGLGLFETCRTWNSHPTLLPRHLRRLRRSAAELDLALDPANLPDSQAVRDLLIADGREGDAVLRITLSGGVSASSAGALWMRSFPLPQPIGGEGITLGPTSMAQGVPLAGHKTLNYWQNRLMFDDARGKGCDESLTISADGIVWEGSRSNIFVVIDGELLTPPCDGRVLPGIMRAVVLEQAVQLGLNVRETPLRLVDPSFRPREVFLTNSVRGIMPVGQWGAARYPTPGTIARRLWDEILPWLESGGTRP